MICHFWRISLCLAVGGVLNTAIAQSFMEVTNTGISAFRDARLAWGDYDGDGDLDLYGGRIYRNDGTNGFALVPVALIGVEFSSADWGDLDNDGDLDLLLSGQSYLNYPNYTRIYRNNGGDSFTELNPGLIGVHEGVSQWGDYNNDGDLDLLMAGGDAGGVFRNNGDGTFTDIHAGIPAHNSAGASWGDFDSDGDLDVAYVGHSAYPVLMFRNDGLDQFAKLTVAPLSGGYPHMVAADFDNDGRLDILVNFSSSSHLLRNKGGLSFEVEPDVFRSGLSWATSGDLDADGFADVLLSTSWSFPGGGLFRNLAGTSFTNAWDPGVCVSVSAVGDWDGDGDLDIAYSGQPNGHTGCSVFKLYRNEGVSNSPPTAPSGLTASVTGAGAVLKWEESADPNQSGGLTYNLRVGTAPGRGNIVSPMADSAGRRLKPARGNAGSRLEWPLRNLAVGSYFWSVQAIDQSFSGSPFAVEGSFSIGPAPPLAFSGKGTPYANATAILAGEVHPNAQETIWRYEFGSDANYGNVTGWRFMPAGGGRSPVSVTISNLHLGATYHFRLVGSNASGITLSTDATFLSAPQFTKQGDLVPSVGQIQSLAAVDYDSDGWMDVAVTGLNTALFRNNLGNGFTGPLNLLPAASAASWGDFDNDGRVDVLLSGVPPTYSALILRNTETGFVPLAGALPTNSTGRAQWIDFDADGRLDVALRIPTNSWTYVVQLHRNARDGTFPEVGPIFAAESIQSTAWGDYDGDGDSDLLVTGRQWPTGYTRLFRNDAGQFTSQPHNIPGLDGIAEWLDSDGDGHLDVLAQGTFYLAHLGGGRVVVKDGAYLFRQDTTGQFTEVEVGGSDLTYHGGIAWGDMNNDGRIDLAYSGTDLSQYYPQTRIMRSLGHDAFGLPVELAPPWGKMSFLDFDNDRDLDTIMIPITSAFGATAIRFRNNEVRMNSAPKAPADLKSTISNDGVLLSWSAAVDSNQLTGHTYSVRVGTATQRGDVLSQAANPGTGFRRQPTAGNAGARLSYLLRKIPPGKYYWSVQAVDSSFVGSMFASEMSFEIGPRILSLRVVSPGTLEFVIDGNPDERYQLESSANLITWSDVLTLEMQNHQTSFLHSIEGEPPRFFRLKSL